MNSTHEGVLGAGQRSWRRPNRSDLLLMIKDGRNLRLETVSRCEGPGECIQEDDGDSDGVEIAAATGS